MAFSYNTENGGSLTPSQEDLLGGIETLPFPFKGITTLKTFRERKQIQVVVSGRAFLVKLLENNIERISEQINKYQNDPNRAKIMAQIERDIYERRRWAERQLEEAKNPNKRMTLLGLYSRKLLWFDNSAPVVYLFADNINDCANAAGQNPDNVFGYVFIHEMMHAYYDAFNSDGYPSWEELEEAFAEFGMLTFLKNSLGLPVGILNDAIDHVREKIISGPREYGFGYELFDRTGGGDKMMISRYMEISNWIDAELVYTLSPNYFHDIWTYKRDPNDENATKCFNGVVEILKYNWMQPSIIIQPKVRGGRPSTSHGPRRLHESVEWAMTSTMEGWDVQYPIIRNSDLMQLLAEVLREMKSDGFEDYLSISRNSISFLGRGLSLYATSLRPRAVPESLCVRGISVYPVFFTSSIHTGSIGNLLHAMSILYRGVFTLVNDGLGYTLYGPAHFADRFLYEEEKGMESAPAPIEPEMATSSTASPKGCQGPYLIVEKSTSKVIAEVDHMTETVWTIIYDYCEKNSGISFSDLQRIFGAVSCGQNLGKNCGIALKVDADKDRADARARGVKFDKRFNTDEPITLATGEVIVVSNQWDGRPGQNFNDFKDVAESLGYEIR